MRKQEEKVLFVPHLSFPISFLTISACCSTISWKDSSSISWWQVRNSSSCQNKNKFLILINENGSTKIEMIEQNFKIKIIHRHSWCSEERVDIGHVNLRKYFVYESMIPHIMSERRALTTYHHRYLPHLWLAGSRCVYHSLHRRILCKSC